MLSERSCSTLQLKNEISSERECSKYKTELQSSGEPETYATKFLQIAIYTVSIRICYTAESGYKSIEKLDEPVLYKQDFNNFQHRDVWFSSTPTKKTKQKKLN